MSVLLTNELPQNEFQWRSVDFVCKLRLLCSTLCTLPWIRPIRISEYQFVVFDWIKCVRRWLLVECKISNSSAHIASVRQFGRLSTNFTKLLFFIDQLTERQKDYWKIFRITEMLFRLCTVLCLRFLGCINREKIYAMNELQLFWSFNSSIELCIEICQYSSNGCFVQYWLWL